MKIIGFYKSEIYKGMNIAMEYINREDVMRLVCEISPCKSDYFYIGVAEEWY